MKRTKQIQRKIIIKNHCTHTSVLALALALILLSFFTIFIFGIFSKCKKVSILLWSLGIQLSVDWKIKAVIQNWDLFFIFVVVSIALGSLFRPLIKFYCLAVRWILLRQNPTNIPEYETHIMNYELTNSKLFTIHSLIPTIIIMTVFLTQLTVCNRFWIDVRCSSIAKM